jgi:hypothetical protein
MKLTEILKLITYTGADTEENCQLDKHWGWFYHKSRSRRKFPENKCNCFLSVVWLD